MAAVKSARVQERRQRRNGMALLAGLGLVGLSALTFGGEAWAVPGASSRRSAAAALAAAVLGASQVQDARAAPDGFTPRAGPAGEAVDVDDVRAYQDSAEVVAKRNEFRKTEGARQEALKEQFRQWFTEFAAEGQNLDRRVELLKQMQDMTLKEKMLPIGITREDVVKGVRAVKYNEGCIKAEVKKGDCKTLEKAYMKLLSSIDKVYDRSLVVAR
eukprot:gb/GFBE01017922.1/.p1 GENE.gb/GFBE01017922.1/~~gb/GFBE01017922.1/.p1  ORF type:complete len:215 (+),score=72.00 gb/GFBE01017922.1/:1-645(+)